MKYSLFSKQTAKSKNDTLKDVCRQTTPAGLRGR